MSPPVLPPFTPYQMPPANYTFAPERFEALINNMGMRMYWFKSHTCPCTYAGPTPGSAAPNCVTCQGRGIYWDNPVGPFTALITFIHTSPTPDEPGAIVNTEQGQIYNGEPALTIGYNNASGVWDQATIWDMFVEADSVSRLSVKLVNGIQKYIPYQQRLSIAPSGAVTLWDATAAAVVTNVPYTVSGAAVTLGSGYPEGTQFIVEFTASPAYVAYRQAGAPAHVRPFGGGLKEPKRYRLQLLDLWLRANNGTSTPVLGPGS